MKSEQRHKLQTNKLADTLGHEIEYVKPYFKTIEPIFRKYEGRPHWGKLNTLQREDFRKLYPRWDDFVEVRRTVDPNGRFLNPYLAGLFG